MKKRKTIWAYVDGVKLIDVVQVALDNNLMVEEVKKILVEKNKDHEVEFKVQ